MNVFASFGPWVDDLLRGIATTVLVTVLGAVGALVIAIVFGLLAPAWGAPKRPRIPPTQRWICSAHLTAALAKGSKLNPALFCRPAREIPARASVVGGRGEREVRAARADAAKGPAPSGRSRGHGHGGERDD